MLTNIMSVNVSLVYTEAYHFALKKTFCAVIFGPEMTCFTILLFISFLPHFPAKVFPKQVLLYLSNQIKTIPMWGGGG